MLDIFITSVLFPGLLCWGIFMGIVMAVGSVVYVVGREVKAIFSDIRRRSADARFIHET